MKLRGKLLLVALSVLVLPWAGWQLLHLLGDVLREGEEQALRATAEAVARGLSLRPAQLPAAGEGVFAPALLRAPRLDGRVDDWSGADASYALQGDGDASASIRFGSVDDTLYLFIRVADASRQRGDAHWRIVDRLDHVRLDLHGRQGVVELRLANSASGVLIATGSDGATLPVQLRGTWLDTPDGYAIELALPQGYALRALSVRVVDAAEERPPQVLVNAGSADAPVSWPVLTESPALAGSLSQLLPPGTQAQLRERGGWRIARAGSLADRSQAPTVPAWRRWLYQRVLFKPVLGDAEAPVQADDYAASDDHDGDIDDADPLAWYRSDGADHAVLAVTVPVTVAGETRAQLQVQRRSDALMRLTDQAFSGLLMLTLLALAAVVVGLVLFAGRLSARIRHLRDAAGTALDRDGRVRAFPVSSARDEIGDLSRSFAALLGEVGVYTGYLRSLAGKLSHELNTPIAIVRTSLENLEADPQGPSAATYLERARGGIERLGALVRAMSEATRIEHAIAGAELETFDLRALVADCAEGYRPLLSPRDLRLELPATPLRLHGAPELVAQALDKLIDNAIGFCPDDGWIRIGLAAEGDGARLSVANRGPLLPAAMRDKLFDSLVSLREKSRDGGVHLGFGLYVVKLVTDLHRGRVEAADLPAGNGVEFILHLRGAVEGMAGKD
jgi:two-component system sensor histidine kinase ChvG